MGCQTCGSIDTHTGTQRAGQAEQLTNRNGFESRARLLEGFLTRDAAESDREIPGLANDSAESSDDNLPDLQPVDQGPRDQTEEARDVI